ncbi:MAG TPA: PhzF family phenazine biosynthesis protein, partial [Jiangellaceae bacterium]
MLRRFQQVDVFSPDPLGGNPLAVVLDSEGLSTEQMQAFTRWMNLSETTFLLPPTTADADYRVRIFTLPHELPFAGHPTLGSCHAWLTAGGMPRQDDVIVQESGIGLVRIRRHRGTLAFAAPALLRSGPVDDALLDQIAAALRIERSDIVDAEWADNGPGWVAVMLDSADAVLALEPAHTSSKRLDIGVVGPYPP